MSSTLRSKQGCWTCRLRKKKCDEASPQCSVCTSLAIACYGYGPKPDWMDGGEREKAVADGIKQVVKYTSRRKASTRPSAKLQALAPKLIEDGGPIPLSVVELQIDNTSNPSLDNGSTKEQEAPSAIGEDNSLFESVLSMSPEESILLMHFLDNVFPHQYPMYKPDVFDGGRGWLLAMLMRTKPLYHAAMALSSYHRRVLVFSRTGPICRAIGTLQQESHLEICLTEFRKAMQSVNHYVMTNRFHDSLSTIVSIVQLIFFELFAGENNNAWQIHLRAATDLYNQGCGAKLKSGIPPERFHAGLDPNVPLTDFRAAMAQDSITFKFAGATITWLDIVSSVTSGTAPKLLSFHHTSISDESWTKLDEIMGCKNWAMRILARIAALQALKKRDIHENVFDLIPFNAQAEEIKNELRADLAKETWEGTGILDDNLTEYKLKLSNDTILVTLIFAKSASIYLHLVTHGFQLINPQESAISEVLHIFHTKIPTHLLPALVLPLYLISCVAKTGQEQDFCRNLFSSAPLLDPFFKHRTRILPILEEVWRRRESFCGFSWAETLDLTGDILLV